MDFWYMIMSLWKQSPPSLSVYPGLGSGFVRIKIELFSPLSTTPYPWVKKIPESFKHQNLCPLHLLFSLSVVSNSLPCGLAPGFPLLLSPRVCSSSNWVIYIAVGITSNLEDDLVYKRMYCGICVQVLNIRGSSIHGLVFMRILS